jgi:hypothetical protein
VAKRRRGPSLYLTSRLAPRSARRPPPPRSGALVAHGFVCSMSRPELKQLPEQRLGFDLVRGWARYATRSYPWSVLLFLIAALIAWRMQIGSYEDPGSLRGFARVRQWGSPTDAGQFSVASLALVALYIRPKVTELCQKPELATDWMLLITPVLIATIVGFVVPTWYRAHLAKIKSMTTPAPGAAARSNGPMASFDASRPVSGGGSLTT